MDKFYGFDLGDAESAIARLDRDTSKSPEVLPIRDALSFITAYALLPSGEMLIGESACYDTTATRRSLRFKSRFLTDPETEKDVRRFATGVLGELNMSGALVKGEDVCFYIGCPAGWKSADRERYRSIFESIGYPPARIISESRAALVSATQSKHFQVGYDIMEKPVLVVDIGSSTTDFAFILSGHEVDIETAGEVRLGGGILDEALLNAAVSMSPIQKDIEAALRENPAWKSYLEFAARRLKEKYFSDEEYFQENPCARSIRVLNDASLKLTLKMDADIAKRVLEGKLSELNGKSFKGAFLDSLRDVRSKLGGTLPELLFLTGGVSKLKVIRSWCQEIFPEAVVITGAEPEFSVARGLAWSGRIDEDAREFRKEVAELIASNHVERIVEKNIDQLYRKVVDALVEPILTSVALPVFDAWRDGDIKRLSDIDDVMKREVEVYLHTDEAQQLLVKPISDWLRPVAYELEEETIPICLKHNIPYRTMSLTSYFQLSDVDIHIDAKDVFAVKQLTWMINTIISIIVGLICGGSGLALISGGISGIVVGTIASLLILFLGKDKLQDMFMRMNIPKPMRKMVPRQHFQQRIEKIADEVKRQFYTNLETEKNEEITGRMAEEISEQIEQTLKSMAEVVEIPL